MQQSNGIFAKYNVIAFEKLHLVHPNLNHMYSTNQYLQMRQQKIFPKLMGNFENPISVLLALETIVQIHSLDGKLDKKECVDLLAYFSSSINHWKTFRGAFSVLQELPFYETIHGKFVSLKFDAIYILPSVIPQAGLENWSEIRSVVFLKEQNNLSELMEFLGITSLPVIIFYCDFVFKYFSLLGQEESLVHLTFVKNIFLQLKYSSFGNKSLKELDIWQEHLRKLKFLHSNRENTHFTASHFYDPREEVFRVMLHAEMFPKEPYSDATWLDFLSNIGLVSRVTYGQFVDFAKSVAELAFVDAESANTKSEVLLRHLFKRNDLNGSFISQLKGIAFLKPGNLDINLRKIHPQYGNRDALNRLHFIAFDGAAIEGLSRLVWTVQSILPEMPVHASLKSMNCSIEANTETVARHTITLCTFLAQDSQRSQKKSVLLEHIQTISNVMIDIYQFFKQLSDINTSVKKMLSETPMVIIKELPGLIKPSQLSYDMLESQEIASYLHKLPFDLGPFKELFTQLGTTKSISMEQYADVLKRIHSDANDQELNPDQKCKSVKALSGLFDLVKNAKLPVLSFDLYIPCRDGKLHVSSDVVYEDNSWLKRIPNFNLPIFIDMDEFGYGKETAIAIFKKFQKQHQPKFLSSIIVERRDLGCVNSGSVLADRMKQRLISSVFRNGFERLLQHSYRTIGQQQTVVDARKISGKLSSIQFFGESELKTYLMFENRKLESSERNREYIIDYDADCCKIYIDANYKGGISFDDKLANVINTFTGKRLQGSALTALSRILSCDLSCMHTILDENEITKLSDSFDPFLPPLGSYVPERYYYLLSQDVFVFHPEQYVALEISDPFDYGETGLPVYIFAQIIGRIPCEGSSLDIGAEYRIKVSETDEKVVDSSVLFAFGSGKQPDRATRNADPTDLLSIVLYEGRQGQPNEATRESPRQPPNQSLEEIVADLKRQLTEAWNRPLPTDQWNRFKKRLLFHWHPDKNPDKVSLSTEVFQILQNLIAMLERGENIDDYGVKKPSTKNADEGRPNFNNFHGFNFNNFRDRARQYQRQESSHYQEQKKSSSSWRPGREPTGGNYYRDYFRDFKTKPNPQSQEARRWMRQAKHDFESASVEVRAHDWECMKYYRVCSFSRVFQNIISYKCE